MAFEWRSNSKVEGMFWTTSPFANGAGAPQLTPVSDGGGFAPTNASTNTAGYQPGPGDDTSPPNAVTDAKLINGIAVPVSSSGGWSNHPPRERVYPSSIDYHVDISESDSLKLGVVLEYTNSFTNESMMVQVAVAKSHLHGTQELALVSTKFQEWVVNNNEWVDITADVDYTITADEVVKAVLADSECGQTAGKATVTAETVQVTLGPFSKRARLLLEYTAETVYTYQAMSIDGTGIGSYRLCPLLIALPFALPDHEAGLTTLSVALSTPRNTEILSIERSKEAYVHLKSQEIVKSTELVALTDLVRQDNQKMGCTLRWGSLPPRSCSVLAWMVFPNDPDEDFVDIGKELAQMKVNEEQVQAVVQVPSPGEASSLQVPLPGHGPMGNLYRIRMTMPRAKPRRTPCFILNLTLSDKSGSTSRESHGVTMRHRFNELAEARFLKRLESIPTLIEAGVLMPDDVWMDAFLPFDHSAPPSAIKVAMFRVRDVSAAILSEVASIRATKTGPTLQFAGSTKDMLQHDSGSMRMIREYVDALRGVAPGGLTDFSAGPTTIAQEYKNWELKALDVLPKEAGRCTFLEFDTDGGHNRGQGYLEPIKKLCEVAHVRNGVVTGFGSWLNQDCASKVAAIIGSVPAQLSLSIPEPGSEGLDLIFRRSFGAWVAALRQAPSVTLKLTAGSVAYPSSATSTRQGNALEVLAVRRLKERHEGLPVFGPPDVSDQSFTSTVLQQVPAGDHLLIYAISRLETAASLAAALEILCVTDNTRTQVSTEAEKSVGTFLAWDWLNILTSTTPRSVWSPIMKTSLRDRLEEEVSFRFNLPSPSGKTSYLGRCKTVADRAPIKPELQPGKPHNPVTFDSPWVEPSSVFSQNAFGAPPSAGPAPSGSLFGSSASAPFGGSAPAPTGNLFGSPASARFGGSAPALFGAAAPAPSASFGAAPPGGFGAAAPAPGTFGYSPSGTGGFRSSNEKDAPLWTHAVKVPMGYSSQQGPLHIRQIIFAVRNACRELANDPHMNYCCDVCKSSILEPIRFHCFDCDNFDTCFNCRGEHKIPFHRLVPITHGASPSNVPEDPLVATLLHSTPQVPPPKDDRTMVWSKLCVERFLLAVLHWWPLLRSLCSKPDRLPDAIPDHVAAKIRESTRSGGDLSSLLEVATVVMDSIEREEEPSNQ